MKYKIYKLIYNNKVIYIGYTEKGLMERFNKNHPFIPIEIKNESSIELIEETDDKSREEYWRDLYEKLGFKLYNKIKGIGVDNKKYIKEWRDNNTDKVKERRKEWNEKNKEEILEYNREYNKRDNRKQYLIEYREKNKENRKQYNKEYNKKNRERLNNNLKKHREKNKKVI